MGQARNAVPGSINITALKGDAKVAVVGGPRDAQADARQIATAPYKNEDEADTTYTFALADANGVKKNFTNAGAITATVPPESDVAFEEGAQITLMQAGAGTVTIAAGAGVTVNAVGGATGTSGQYALAALIYEGSDVWTLVGSIA